MSAEPGYEYGDEEALAKALAEKRKTARDQELDDIRAIIKAPWGQRFFVRMFSDAKIFSTTYSKDHSESSFLEGHRNLALRYFNDIAEAYPEAIPQLMVQGERHSEQV